jgi:hypothetical protein
MDLVLQGIADTTIMLEIKIYMEHYITGILSIQAIYVPLVGMFLLIRNGQL